MRAHVIPRASLFCLVLLCALTAFFALGASAARAERALIKENLIPEFETKRVKGGQIEGACGVAIGGGQTFVSDYYHRTIDIFPDGSGRIAAGPLDGFCGLAFGPDGALYANEWHQGVSRVLPSVQSIDSDESTGVAVDQASGDVYVDDRTYVARYEAPIAPEEPPAQIIGLGSLGEGFGVAVEAGRVYVPDAADNTIKVYEPAVDPLNPVLSFSPPGGFSSLTDAAITTDPTNGHVLVLDNLQPGFEFPEAAVEEFSSSGTFLGSLSRRVIDGEPSGLSTSEGNVYVTDGNSEESNVMQFGPYVGGGGGFAPLAAPSPSAVPTGAQEASSPAPALAPPRLRPAAAKRRPKHHKGQRRVRLGERAVAGRAAR